MKENRTYDQVLGDLGRGNGDPSLTLFGASVTPNEHALAKNFVTLDNFLDAGEVSGNGWPWSTERARPMSGVKAIPMQYAGRGQSYDVEGTNRNVNVAHRLDGRAPCRRSGDARRSRSSAGHRGCRRADAHSGEEDRGISGIRRCARI